jgi:hypothetical protein
MHQLGFQGKPRKRQLRRALQGLEETSDRPQKLSLENGSNIFGQIVRQFMAPGYVKSRAITLQLEKPDTLVLHQQKEPS